MIMEQIIEIVGSLHDYRQRSFSTTEETSRRLYEYGQIEMIFTYLSGDDEDVEDELLLFEVADMVLYYERKLRHIGIDLGKHKKTTNGQEKNENLRQMQGTVRDLLIREKVPASQLLPDGGFSEAEKKLFYLRLDTEKEREKNLGMMYLDIVSDCLLIRVEGSYYEIGLLDKEGESLILVDDLQKKSFEFWVREGKKMNTTPVLWQGRRYKLDGKTLCLYCSIVGDGQVYNFEPDKDK